MRANRNTLELVVVTFGFGVLGYFAPWIACAALGGSATLILSGLLKVLARTNRERDREIELLRLKIQWLEEKAVEDEGALKMPETPPRDRCWHWVRTSDGWFPALRFGDTWTNQDTWEDFHDEVVEWIEIPFPRSSSR